MQPQASKIQTPWILDNWSSKIETSPSGGWFGTFFPFCFHIYIYICPGAGGAAGDCCHAGRGRRNRPMVPWNILENPPIVEGSGAGDFKLVPFTIDRLPTVIPWFLWEKPSSALVKHHGETMFNSMFHLQQNFQKSSHLDDIPLASHASWKCCTGGVEDAEMLSEFSRLQATHIYRGITTWIHHAGGNKRGLVEIHVWFSSGTIAFWSSHCSWNFLRCFYMFFFHFISLNQIDIKIVCWFRR